MRCWLCDIEPNGTYLIEAMESATPVAQIIDWPRGDHEHAEAPPTPDQLEQAGQGTLARIRGEAIS